METKVRKEKGSSDSNDSSKAEASLSPSTGEDADVVGLAEDDNVSPNTNDNDEAESDVTTEADREESEEEENVGDDVTCLARAESCRTSGNEAFKRGEFEEAEKLYLKGQKILKDKELDNRFLLTTFSLNLSLCCSKRENWKQAEKHAKTAVDVIGENHDDEMRSILLKALFRQALALEKMQDFHESKKCLVRLLKLDKSHKEGRVLYVRVKEKAEKVTAQQRKQFSQAFQQGKMYADVEKERKRKALAKIEEEKKRRELWKQDGRGLSFEEWERVEKKKEEDERKRAEKERKKMLEEERKLKTAQESEEVELDEEERKLLEETKKRGYCYFKVDRTEEEQKLLAQASQVVRETTKSEKELSSSALTSAWNSNGTTWEERDISEAARADLKAALASIGEICFPDLGKKIQVTSVPTVTGDAQIVVTRKKPAPLFDLSASVCWEVTSLDAAEEEKICGTIKLPDITNGINTFEIECSTTSGRSEIDFQDPIAKLQQAIQATVANFIKNLC